MRHRRERGGEDSPGRRGVRAGEGCIRTRGRRPWGQALPMRPEEWGRASTSPRPAFLRSVTFRGVLPAPHQQVSGLTELQVPPQDGVQCGLSHPSPWCSPSWGNSGSRWSSSRPRGRKGCLPSFPMAEGSRGGSWLWDGRPSSGPEIPQGQGWEQGRERPTFLPIYVPQGREQGAAGRAHKLQNSLGLRDSGPSRGWAPPLSAAPGSSAGPGG